MGGLPKPGMAGSAAGVREAPCTSADVNVRRHGFAWQAAFAPPAGLETVAQHSKGGGPGVAGCGNACPLPRALT